LPYVSHAATFARHHIVNVQRRGQSLSSLGWQDKQCH
jgi:hypothetical protein